MNLRRSLDWWLAVAGAALPLLYIPNGVLHLFLGKAVYGRDILLALHFGLACFCLFKTGHVQVLRKGLLPLAVIALFFTPLFLASSSLKAGITAIKWVLMWGDVMLTGYLIYLQRRFLKTVALAVFAGMALITIDVAIGAYELHANRFVFNDDKEEETEAGNRVTRSQQLAGQVRVQGMQRDVFTYANLMALGCVTCIIVFVTQRGVAVRTGSVLAGCVYLTMLYLSGGRSGFFGVLVAAILAAFALISPREFQRRARSVLVCAVLAGWAMCAVGLGSILAEVVSWIGSDARAFSLASTYDRDGVWVERLASMTDAPLSFLTGIPFSDWASGDLPSVDFADNQMLWFLYHTGLIGTAVILLLLFRCAAPPTRAQHPQAYVALVLFMGLVLGEGTVREAMLLFGVLPLFALSGWFIGSEAYATAPVFEEEPDGTLTVAMGT